MRMWIGVPPRILCRQHLLGEHNEIHKFVGAVNKGKNLQGYYDKKLLFPNLARYRHLQLVTEMQDRGYQHLSPLPDFQSKVTVTFDPKQGWRNIDDLLSRCAECRQRTLLYAGAIKEELANVEL